MEVIYQLKLVRPILATMVKMVTVGTHQISDDDNQCLMMKVMHGFIWNKMTTPFAMLEQLPPISLKRFPRTLSAPATLKLHRQNSAKIYNSKMVVKPPPKRAQSAIPTH